jgi:hypothetical protein
MARHPPEPYVSASRQRPRLNRRALIALFVGVVGAVTVAWFVALALLTLWLVRAVF